MRQKIIPLTVLKLVLSGIKFPGYPAFCVADKMKLIKYPLPNFTECFSDMKVAATPPCQLDDNELTGNARDTLIIVELGKENCEAGVSVLFWGIETGYLVKRSLVFTLRQR